MTPTTTAPSKARPDSTPAVAPRRTGITSRTAWTPTDELKLHQWVETGRRLGTTARCSQWWMGDWLRYGTARWGEKYKEASQVTGYDIQTLKNVVYVASRFDASRRRDNLAWSHHETVASLDPDEQDKWLALAAEQKLSVADLRLELRTARRALRATETPEDERPADALTSAPYEAFSSPTDSASGHQEIVSALEPDEQKKWLAVAAEQKLSVAELRIELLAAGKALGATETSQGEYPRHAPTPTIPVVCPECKYRFAVPVTFDRG